MVQSALGQRLHLAGLILSSSMPYPTGPIETITPDIWHETFQSSLLGPISLIQSFLPLVLTPYPCTDNSFAHNPLPRLSSSPHLSSPLYTLHSTRQIQLPTQQSPPWP